MHVAALVPRGGVVGGMQCDVSPMLMILLIIHLMLLQYDHVSATAMHLCMGNTWMILVE
jgi:hypothetical protein